VSVSHFRVYKKMKVTSFAIIDDDEIGVYYEVNQGDLSFVVEDIETVNVTENGVELKLFGKKKILLECGLAVTRLISGGGIAR
jgi:hypothetical protein